jgi:hypothetical protein
MMSEDNVQDTRPKGTVVAILHPPWFTEIAAAKNGSILQLHHPVHGWLTFILPAECSHRLGAGLLKQAALIEYFDGSVPPSTVTVN